MTLVANGERRPVEFDSAVSTQGWNELGEFDLDAGLVSLEVSNKTTGNVVFADAIRWKPGGARFLNSLAWNKSTVKLGLGEAAGVKPSY